MIFLLKYWRYASAGVLMAALAGGVLWVRHGGIVSGRAQVQATFDTYKASVAATAVKAIADAQAKEAASAANNERVMHHANEELLAIAADRDSLSQRMRDYENRLRASAMRSATDQRGIDAATGIARSAAELDAAFDRYDVSCRRDAVRFAALQDEILPWITSP